MSCCLVRSGKERYIHVHVRVIVIGCVVFQRGCIVYIILVLFIAARLPRRVLHVHVATVVM